MLAISDYMQIQLVTGFFAVIITVFSIAFALASREHERWRLTEWELHARLDDLAERMANNPLPPPSRRDPVQDALADLKAAYVTNGITLAEFEEQVGHLFSLRIVQHQPAQVAHHQKVA